MRVQILLRAAVKRIHICRRSFPNMLQRWHSNARLVVELCLDSRELLRCDSRLQKKGARLVALICLLHTILV